MDQKCAETTTTDAVALANQAMAQFSTTDNHHANTSLPVPKTSIHRQQDSLTDQPFDLPSLLANCDSDTERHETVLYLGYGSNLSAETFLGRRGIRPISQVNVVVPAIQLSFNLPGVPYSEPCFGNCRFRSTGSTAEHPADEKYHKNAWKKGLVGVVYEVTKADYAHIIATEGGGAGYQDILVDCFALGDDPDEEVPAHPSGAGFKSHTLFAQSRQSLRQDPDYAQPSPRYLKLITDGAVEHDLPLEYRKYLENIGTYHITTTRQKLGAILFLAIWGPIFAFMFRGGARRLLRPDGTYPKWYVKLTRTIFALCWGTYDFGFAPVFGDGERTIDSDATEAEAQLSRSYHEKSPLLPLYTPRRNTSETLQ